MKIQESIYYYLLSPKEAIKKGIRFEYALIIYLISSLSMSVSLLYSIGSKSNVINLLVLTFGIAAYIAVSNMAKIAVINLTASIFSRYDEKNNLKDFITNCFGIYGIFIYMSPITLIFSRTSGLGIFQIIIFIIFQIYYLILLYNNIKFSFRINNSFKTFIILLSPIILDYITYMSLGMLLLGIFVNIV